MELFPFLLVRLQTLTGVGQVRNPRVSFHSFQLGCKHCSIYVKDTANDVSIPFSQAANLPAPIPEGRLSSVSIPFSQAANHQISPTEQQVSLGFHSFQLGCKHKAFEDTHGFAGIGFHSFQLGCKLTVEANQKWRKDQFPFLLVRLQTFLRKLRPRWTTARFVSIPFSQAANDSSSNDYAKTVYPFPFLLVRLQTLMRLFRGKKTPPVSIPFSQAANTTRTGLTRAGSLRFPFLLVRLQT